MRKLFFIFTLFFLYLNSSGQIKYSVEAKKFIDYDTAVIAFQHALLIDGTGSAAKPNQTIIIKNGKIDWLGDDAKAVFPKQAQSIDLNGKTLMPGFVMLHEHLYIAVPIPGYFFGKQMPISFPRLYLACGATTTRTASSHEPFSDIGIKRDIDSGRFPGPTLFLTAPYMQGKESTISQMQRVTTIENAINSVNYWADQGFTSFKAYNTIEKHILKAAIDAAHKRGLKVTGHLCSVTYREAAEAGIDHLEHGFYRSNDFVPNKQPNICPPDQGIGTNAKLDIHSDGVKSLMQLLISKKISLTSTLPNYESATTTQPVPNPEVLEMLCSDQRDAYLKRYFAVKAVKSPHRNDSAFMNTAKMEKLFYEMGGLLGVGTDPTGSGGNIAGFGNWRAIELLVEAAGFTPLEALKIATLNGATVLGIDKITGTIEAGKEADLIVIDGDPSKNISDIRKVVWVFKDGVGFNSKKMIESVKGKVGYY